ncbi:hypothetical protein RvY_01740 [Ramazzottius varieornatus]|uniref:Uncharacterized protein n=1 Tax=Ramazzottius varieornatus TaxID=947166 RepID=A0A1D1UHK0_RAMVA|nr:hypothetical protein RvY_01740 [Ramazzottius varieornatus]
MPRSAVEFSDIEIYVVTRCTNFPELFSVHELFDSVVTNVTTYEEYERALFAYQNRTFQLFTAGNSKKPKRTHFEGSPSKTARSIRNCESAVFAQIIQVCAHGGPRRHRGTGVRETTHTRKIHCPVEFMRRSVAGELTRLPS